MNPEINPIREGFHSVTPSLTIRGAAQAIEFYQKVFGAEEFYRMASPEGKILHAEIKIGSSVLMINDEAPEWGCLSPQAVGGSPISLMLYVPDVDAVFARALAAGATQVRPLTNQFYGDRSGMVQDPFGHRWSLATQIENVSPEEMKRREKTWIKENDS